MTKPASIAALIEKLTPAAMSGALDVSVQAISNMKQRDAIPPKHRDNVVALAKKTPGLQAFTYEDLVRLHTDARRRRQRESASPNHQRAGVG